MKPILLLVASGLLLLAGTMPALADPFSISFTALPSDGAISGPPGATIGWGYTLSNLDPINWLLITSLDSSPFSFASADASLFDYPILSPGSTVSVAYDPTQFAGLLQITWDSSAPVDFTNSGKFALTGLFYDGDPFGGGVIAGPEISVSAAYTATVTAPVNAPVPEPATLILLSSGLAGIAVFARKRKKRLSSRD